MMTESMKPRGVSSTQLVTTIALVGLIGTLVTHVVLASPLVTSVSASIDDLPFLLVTQEIPQQVTVYPGLKDANVAYPVDAYPPVSYSGYFSVNKTYGANLFYWFFETQVA